MQCRPYSSTMGECSQIVKKKTQSECPDIWIRFPRHKWPKLWESIEDPAVSFSNRNYIWTPIDLDCYGKDNWRKLLLELGWEIISQLGMFVCSSKTRIILYQKTWVTSQWLEREQNDGFHVEEIDEQKVDLDEPTSFLDHVYLGCTQRECKPNETIIEKYRVFRLLGGFFSSYSAGFSNIGFFPGFFVKIWSEF